MANVTTKFKVEVDGIDEYIDNLEQAEELISSISDKLKNGDLSLDETVELTKTLEDLETIKTTIELTNEVANKQVEIIAKQNTELGKQVGIVEAQLATVDILNEAYALQDKTIGLAKSEAERLLEITELQNEAETLLTTELGKQKLEAERNLTLAEAQAESLAATPGSIRQLNAELEKANLELENLSPDSEGFKRAKDNAAQLQLQIDGLSRTSKEQKEANFALADSFVGTFGQGAALVSSFAGENENLQAVLLKLEQALAAVEAVRSAIALIEQVQNELRLKQGKKLAEAKAKEIKASNDKANAEKKEVAVIKEVVVAEKQLEKQTNELVDANENLTDSNKSVSSSYEDLSDATTAYTNDAKKANNSIESSGKSSSVFGKAINGLKSGFATASQGAKSFGASLLATGIPIIIGAVVGLVSVLVLLKDKIKPVADALNFVEDVVGGFTGVLSNAGNIVLKFVSSLSNVASSIKSIFSGDFTKGIDELKNSFNGLGDELANSFKKGFDKSGKLRLLAEQENLNKLTAISKNNLIERLSLEAKNADEVSKLKQAQLQQEASIAKQKLLLTNNLSEAEFTTLTKGTEAEIKALKERLKARGDFSDSLIEGLQEVADKENELQAERKAQFDARVDAAKEARDLQLDIDSARLDSEKGTDAEIAKAKIELEKTNNDINARIAKGEKVNLDERKLAQINYANTLKDIQDGIDERTKDALNEASDITKQADIDQLANAEAQGDKLEDIAKANADKLLAVQKQFALDSEKLAREREKALEDVNDPAERAAIEAKFNAKVLDLERKANTETLKLRKELADATEKDRKDRLAKEVKAIEDSAKQLTDIAKTQKDEALNNDKLSFVKRLDLLKQSLANELSAIKLGESAKLKALGLSNEQIETLREKGVDGLSSAYKDLDKTVIASAGNIIESSKLSTNAVVADNEKSVNTVKNSITVISKEQKQAIDLANEAVTLALDTIANFINQGSEAQIAAFDKQSEAINERLDETNSKLDDAKGKTDELTENLKKARGSDRKTILANLKAQQDQEKALTKQKLDDEAKLKAIDEQKKAEQKKQAEAQKAFSIVQAIINGALAVTNILATVPKFDFGIISAIQVGIAIATTAAQVATIAAQPIPEFAQGGYTADGEASKPVGVVHAGEWVAPKWMVKSPKYRNDIMKLESMRSNGYAQGGFVQSSSNTTVTNDNNAQFDKLLGSITSLAQRPIYTNVVTVSDEQQRINNIRTKASI